MVSSPSVISPPSFSIPVRTLNSILGTNHLTLSSRPVNGYTPTVLLHVDGMTLKPRLDSPQLLSRNFPTLGISSEAGIAPPTPQGYRWEDANGIGPLRRRLWRLVKLEPRPITQMDSKRCPEDWPMPLPTDTNGWTPIAWLKVADIARMDPHFRTHTLVELVLTKPQRRGGEPVIFQYFKERFLDQIYDTYGTYAVTLEKIYRTCPLSFSFQCSVAGWPLKYVNTNYLAWYSSQGEIKGTDFKPVSPKKWKGLRTLEEVFEILAKAQSEGGAGCRRHPNYQPVKWHVEELGFDQERREWGYRLHLDTPVDPRPWEYGPVQLVKVPIDKDNFTWEHRAQLVRKTTYEPGYEFNPNPVGTISKVQEVWRDSPEKAATEINRLIQAAWWKPEHIRDVQIFWNHRARTFEVWKYPRMRPYGELPIASERFLSLPDVAAIQRRKEERDPELERDESYGTGHWTGKITEVIGFVDQVCTYSLTNWYYLADLGIFLVKPRFPESQRELFIEQFKTTGVSDRFYKHGSLGPPTWIETNSEKYFSGKVLATIREGDSDPRPENWTLAGVFYLDSMAWAAEHYEGWRPGLREEGPLWDDWQTPRVPTTKYQAWRKTWELLNRFTYLVDAWKRRNDRRWEKLYQKAWKAKDEWHDWHDRHEVRQQLLVNYLDPQWGWLAWKDQEDFELAQTPLVQEVESLFTQLVEQINLSRVPTKEEATRLTEEEIREMSEPISQSQVSKQTRPDRQSDDRKLQRRRERELRFRWQRDLEWDRDNMADWYLDLERRITFQAECEQDLKFLRRLQMGISRGLQLQEAGS